MLYAFARDAEFRQLTQFVSPAFFRVMPAAQLLAQARQLLANRRDAARFDGIIAQRKQRLGDAGLRIALRTDQDAPQSSVGRRPEAARGLTTEERAAALVELYFHQLFDDGASIIDLRRDAFEAQTDFVWQPAPWFVEWDPAFIAGLRQLYTGFYTGDTQRFQHALSELQLQDAESAFRRHFGAGQKQVLFTRKHFVQTFQEVFVRCSESGRRLHPNFLPLGIYLATLYDHAEQLGVAVDVEAAFHRTVLGTVPLRTQHA